MRNSILLTYFVVGCSPVFAADVLYFLTAPNDKSIKAVFDRRVKTLQKCGVKVATSESANVNEWKAFLNEHPQSGKATVILEGHGFLPWNQDLLLMNFSSEEEFPSEFNNYLPARDIKEELARSISRFPGQVARASDFLAALTSSGVSANVWLDTCHAGACQRCMGVGLGAACGIDEKSYNVSQFTDSIIDLLCSAKNDCQTWFQADKNRDGVIKPQELQQLWENRFGQVQEITASVEFEKDADEQAILRKLEESGLFDIRVIKTELAIPRPIVSLKYRSLPEYEFEENQDLSKKEYEKLIEDEKTQTREFTINFIEALGISVPVLPQNPLSKSNVTEWENAARKAILSKKGILLREATKGTLFKIDEAEVRIRYLPGEITYQAKKQRLSPFSESDRKKLGEKDRYLTPRLDNFELHAPRCDRSLAHAKTNAQQTYRSEKPHAKP